MVWWSESPNEAQVIAPSPPHVTPLTSLPPPAPVVSADSEVEEDASGGLFLQSLSAQLDASGLDWRSAVMALASQQDPPHSEEP
jgi:hypothetical protein